MWGGRFPFTDENFLFRCDHSLVKAFLLASLGARATLACRWKEFLQLLLERHLVLEFHFCVIYFQRVELVLHWA